MSWDTGSHLNVAYGADSCHRVATDAEVKVSLDRLGKTRQTGPRCPRCGAKPDCYDHQQQALSRRADIQICNRCGTEEALEDIAWGGHQNLPLADWAIVKGAGSNEGPSDQTDGASAGGGHRKLPARVLPHPRLRLHHSHIPVGRMRCPGY